MQDVGGATEILEKAMEADPTSVVSNPAVVSAVFVTLKMKPDVTRW